MIDPITGIAIGSAVVGGISNLLSGDPEEERLEKLRGLIDKRKGEVTQNYKDTELNLLRYASMAKNLRQRTASQKNTQYGMNPSASMYQDVADIDMNVLNAVTQLQSQKNAEIGNLSNKLLEAEASYVPESDFESLVGGGLMGLDLATKVMAMFPASTDPKLGEATGGDNIKIQPKAKEVVLGDSRNTKPSSLDLLTNKQNPNVDVSRLVKANGENLYESVDTMDGLINQNLPEYSKMFALFGRNKFNLK